MDNYIQRRVIEISYKHNLSHLSSNLTAAPILDTIYKSKKDDEPFILSCGHAGLALYCCLEKYLGLDAEKLYNKYGTHPSFSLEDKIYFSTGSLGMGVCGSIGYALSDRERMVYCIISDGEFFEGKVKEAFSAKKMFKLNNLKIHLNLNGHSALSNLNIKMIKEEAKILCPDIILWENLTELPFNINSVDGHYKKLNKEEYKQLLVYYA